MDFVLLINNPRITWFDAVVGGRAPPRPGLAFPACTEQQEQEQEQELLPVVVPPASRHPAP